MDDIRIVRSGVSVYEIEVDLGKYASTTTADLKGFVQALLHLFPTLQQHECYASEVGGFVKELKSGTDLAHVMEHLILELLKMASGSRRRFTGWTRKRNSRHIIHFQAPDGARASRAALCALRIVESVIEGKRVSPQSAISEIRSSKKDPRGIANKRSNAKVQSATRSKK